MTAMVLPMRRILGGVHPLAWAALAGFVAMLILGLVNAPLVGPITWDEMLRMDFSAPTPDSFSISLPAMLLSMPFSLGAAFLLAKRHEDESAVAMLVQLRTGSPASWAMRTILRHALLALILLAAALFASSVVWLLLPGEHRTWALSPSAGWVLARFLGVGALQTAFVVLATGVVVWLTDSAVAGIATVCAFVPLGMLMPVTGGLVPAYLNTLTRDVGSGSGILRDAGVLAAWMAILLVVAALAAALRRVRTRRTLRLMHTTAPGSREGERTMPVIEVTDISKTIRRRRLLQNASARFERGTITAIVGPNGSGKSVLFRILCGLLPPDTGQVRVDPAYLSADGSHPEGFGILIDGPGYVGSLSGYQNLARLASIRGKVGPDCIREAMRRVGLDPDLATRARDYSLGMKAKLGIAQAIMEDQQILLLDEPFNGLDRASVTRIRGLLLDLRDEGRTIIFTSHNAQDVDLLASSVYEIDGGTLELLVSSANSASS